MKKYKDTMIPLGSIVELKSGAKAMVMGYGVQNKEDNKEYSYIGCDYVFGFAKGNVLFNYEDVENVLFAGYTGEPLINIFNKKLWEALK